MPLSLWVSLSLFSMYLFLVCDPFASPNHIPGPLDNCIRTLVLQLRMACCEQLHYLLCGASTSTDCLLHWLQRQSARLEVVNEVFILGVLTGHNRYVSICHTFSKVWFAWTVCDRYILPGAWERSSSLVDRRPQASKLA